MANHTCNQNCGCTNTYTVTAPCPPACAEVFNAQCIVYTGTDILCNSTTVISRYDYLDTIITKLVNYICSVQAPVTIVTGSTYIDTSAVIVGNVTTYTISLDMPAVQAYFSPIIAQTVAANVTEGQGIDIAVNPVSNVITISHEDTSSVASPLTSNNSGNTFLQDINFTFDTFGHVTGASVVAGTVIPPLDFAQFRISTDVGYTWGPANDPSNPQIAEVASDVLTFVAGAGINLFTSTVGPTDAIRIEASSPASSVTLSSAGTGPSSSLVNDGVGPAIAVKGLIPGTGVSFTSTLTDITLNNTDPGSAVTLSDAGIAPFHVSLVNDGTGPTLAVKSLVAGSGMGFTDNGTDITIFTSAPKKYSASQVLPGAGTLLITHNLNALGVILSIVEDGAFPLNALVPGVDYVYTVDSLNTITIADAAFGGGNIIVTIIG
jgi:hypothetical protein